MTQQKTVEEIADNIINGFSDELLPSQIIILKGEFILALRSERAVAERMREALIRVQWGDGQSGCCQICDADEPEPHKENCIVGIALALQKEEGK